LRSTPVSRILCPSPKRWRRPSLWDARCRAPRCDLARVDGPSIKSSASCFRWGLPERTSPCGSGSSYLPISPLPPPHGAGGMFLWHFPSGHPDRTLSCTSPYEARTFLPFKLQLWLPKAVLSLSKGRPPGVLREREYITEIKTIRRVCRTASYMVEARRLELLTLTLPA
jgi:hypothetical protein